MVFCGSVHKIKDREVIYIQDLKKKESMRGQVQDGVQRSNRRMRGRGVLEQRGLVTLLPLGENSQKEQCIRGTVYKDSQKAIHDKDIAVMLL